jgi:hypothetical protein
MADAEQRTEPVRERGIRVRIRHPASPNLKQAIPDTERGNKPGLTGSFPLRKGYKMRRHLLALYVAGATVATLVVANSAVAATWTRR